MPKKPHLLDELAKKYNWHAVALLKGVIKREIDGSKTIPGFKEGYRNKGLASKKTSFKTTHPHLVLTGKESNIVAIDCDNEITASLLRTLDPDNAWHIIPKGKAGLTLLYTYDSELHTSFSTKTPPLALDYLSTGRGFYFPDACNETKEMWEAIPEGAPPAMPKAVKDYLLNFVSKKDTNLPTIPSTDENFEKLTYAALEPLITLACEEQRLSANALRVLTPNKIKQELSEIYKKQGYIKPGNIAKGGGSLYLLAISTILGGDESISPKLYQRAIHLFNDSLQAPLDKDRLANTIINPMLSGKSAVEDKVIWKYDKDWKTKGLSIVNKDGELLNIVINKHTKEVLELNTVTESVYIYDSIHKAVSGINLTTNDAIKTDVLNTRAKLYTVIHDFAQPFGILNEHELNLSKVSPCLAILQNPKDYKKTGKYKRPKETIKFFEHLIPDKEDMIFFLRFLKTKLTTFIPSPIIFSFTGVPGSGKDVMFELLSKMVEPNNVTKPNPKVFISNFNDWLENKLFGLLNEYGDIVTKRYQFDEIKGKLKDITGSTSFLLESKGIRARPATHNITIIMCQNRASPLQDVNDRRFYFIDTPTMLTDAVDNDIFKSSYEGANDAISTLIYNMENELLDFAYYLATEVQLLDIAAYSKPNQKTKANHIGYEGISDTAARLAQVCIKKDWEYLSQQIDAMDNYELTPLDIVALSKNALPLGLSKELLSYWGYLPSTQQINLSMLNAHIQHAKQRAIGGKRIYTYLIPGCKIVLDELGISVEDTNNDFEAYNDIDDSIPGID